MNERLSLQDLIDLLAKKQEITKKDAESFLRELIAVISENIENNESVKIKEFGVFKLVKVNARRSVDVNTGEAIEIAAHYKLSFTPDKSLKEAINRPFAHFESVVLEDGVSFDNIEKEESSELVESEATVDEVESTETSVSNEAAISSIILQEIVTDKPVGEVVPPVSEISEHEPEDIVEEPQDIVVQEEVEETIENVPSVAEVEQQQDEAISSSLPEDKVESDDSETVLVDQKRASKRRRRFISLAFFIFLIIAGFFIGGLYFQEIAKFLTEGPADENKTVAIVEDKKPDAVITPDSLTIKIDSTRVDGVEDPSVVSDKNGITMIDNTTTSAHLATITIEPGSTLRNISLKYYGHKSFWVYIYEENKDKIKNANNVPLGTKLIIPFPAKYGINPQDKASIDTAKQKEQRLFSEMGL
ncbi:MAG: HU family DNA-binding protein [Prevotella sp.]|jgi:nucleoid DNA-binding protein|nr:HU family DNA-binding protein [Prevotella sp.]